MSLFISLIIGAASALITNHRCIDSSNDQGFAFPAPAELNNTVHGAYDPSSSVPLGENSYWSTKFKVSDEEYERTKKTLMNNFLSNYGSSISNIKSKRFYLTWGSPTTVASEIHCPYSQICCLNTEYTEDKWVDLKTTQFKHKSHFQPSFHSSKEYKYSYCFKGPGYKHIQFNQLNMVYEVYYEENAVDIGCPSGSILQIQVEARLGSSEKPIGLISAV
ncbi:hypothetical protein DSO57_1013742 [Entomophthora muscae]|uniref:Uncharacterized protein n=1 Tax=Entomophthora muscae TaxID=34485 RepID=A0ACC2URR6_9FUNG|nr:hypothetical protein DSO57_1013742 [Entomophthora muscae]